MQKLKWQYLCGVSGSLLLVWQLAWHPVTPITSQGLMPMASQMIVQAIGQVLPDTFRDTLPQEKHWQALVEFQTTLSQNQQYRSCLFGDSISSRLQHRLNNQANPALAKGVGQNLGPDIGKTLGPAPVKQDFNFAIGGMSTVSLVAQLKAIVPHQVQCQTVILAIGTNDAMYWIENAEFKRNLKQAITQVRGLQPDRIILLPAFYSTVAASQNPTMAGPIDRVDEINQLIGDVAAEEAVPVYAEATAPLFAARSLRSELTVDGVHLNDAGIALYEEILGNLLDDSAPTAAPTNPPTGT
jgi:lysophospholipase L1-like esterase